MKINKCKCGGQPRAGTFNHEEGVACHSPLCHRLSSIPGGTREEVIALWNAHNPEPGDTQPEAKPAQETQPLSAEMTLRDYFAGQAMVPMIGANTFETNAKNAYRMADAMLAEREKGTK